MTNKKESVALSSVMAGVILTFGKAIVGILTGSMGILSEAAHSLLDLAAAIMTYFAVHVSDRPADSDHPYGHGKIESVSALIETGLLFLTSAWIIYESVGRLISGETHVDAAWYAFAVVIVSIVIDISRSRALYKVAKATKSQALEADALHFSSDIWSSAVVLLGLILVRFFNVNGADCFAAIVVAFFVAVAGYRLGKRTIDVLIEAAPAGVSAEVIEIAKNVDGIASVDRVRARPHGAAIFLDIMISVNRKLSAVAIQKITSELEEKIKQKISEADTVIHTKPVQFDSETIIENVQILAAKLGLSVHDINVDKLDNQKFVAYDLEVPASYTVAKAHKVATSLEEEILKEFGEDVLVNTHIEPLRTEEILSSNVDKEEIEAVNKAISAVDSEIKELENVHDVLVRKVDGKLFVSFHCNAEGDASIEDIHNVSSRFEYLIRQKLPRIKRVVIHTEPK
ncbi:MAG: cation diffusion facilitator family transporter [Candidatus Gracilibacteria bacterium]|jgi:cation diffusion facilitator family transporter